MRSRTFGLKILLWAELVISLRILLFCFPILIHKLIGDDFSALRVADWYLITISIMGFLFLMSAAASLFGHRLGRMFHFWSVGIVILLCAGLYQKMLQIHQSVDPFYLWPAAFALLLVFAMTVLEKKANRTWKSVLIIDDDETLVKTIRPVLIKNGYAVLSASTGEEGLRVARNQQPDLILLDVILPGMKGREVCERLKKDERTKNVPVIFLTAKDSEDDVKAEMAAGALAHISKPVKAAVLLSNIQKFMKDT